MLESLGSVLLGLALVCFCGALLYGYVALRTKRRDEDAEREVPLEDPNQQAKGGGPRPKK